MLTIEELRKRKKLLEYTNADISQKSGVPLGTVQKIFSGATANPRVETLAAIEKVLEVVPYNLNIGPVPVVSETMAEYAAVNSIADDEDRIEEISERRYKRYLEKIGKYGADISGKWPRQGQYTLKDYYDLPDDVRVELINGVIYDMTAPAKIHQRVLASLHLEFERCAEEKDHACEVMFAPVDVRLDRDNRTMVQPDLLVMCRRDDNPKRIEGAPDLVVEIISPSTRRKDCILKLNKYSEAGVREYWVIEPIKETVTVYYFEADELQTQYTFEDSVPIGISGGECSINFQRIRERLERLSAFED